MTRKIGVVAAVLLMLAVPLPAHAQDSAPPSLQANAPLPPGGAPAPDVGYTKSKGCMASATEGKSVGDMPYGQQRLNLEQAHRFATGKGVTVAVIDTGVAEHPRLKGRLEPGGDYVDKSNGLQDCDGHGTEVAGVLAASADASTDFVGAAPEATVLAIRQTSDHYDFKGTPTEPARSRAGTVRTLAQAILHAARSGADVINISVTNCGRPKAFTDGDRLLQAAIRHAVDVEDVVIVTAAGNLGSEGKGCEEQNHNMDPEKVNVVASPPWFADDVLSVASINAAGTVSEFSVWGPWVSLAAPGEGIVSLDPAGPGLINANIDEKSGKPQEIVGTSFASPYVAGVAALVRERFPELTARQVMARLKATAQNPGGRSGRDHKVGHGMVNPVAALTAVIPSERPGSTPPAIKEMITVVNPPPQKDWTPIVWAVGGAGIACALLLLTLFVVHTVNRRSTGPEGASPRPARR